MNLESLKWACEYFAKQTNKIVVQPKHMGSRCQVYLFNDPARCYATSRNGWIIKQDLTHIFNPLIEKFKTEFNNGLQLRILDGELMPWSALGKTLIDSSFYTYHSIASRETELCNQYGLDQAVLSVRDKFNEFKQSELPKKEFVEKFGHQAHTIKNNINTINYILPTNNQSELLKKFLDQVNLYGKDGQSYYLPFDILKDIYENHEKVRSYDSNYEKWKSITDINCLYTSPDSYEEIEEFFNSLTLNNGYEGVVIKPDIPGDFAPYIKVRNPEYLRIVYGHDYTTEQKYTKLCSRKRINSKMRQSIKEWKLGVAMLHIPYNQLGSPEHISILVNFLKEEKEKVDPRL